MKQGTDHRYALVSATISLPTVVQTCDDVVEGAVETGLEVGDAASVGSIVNGAGECGVAAGGYLRCRAVARRAEAIFGDFAVVVLLHAGPEGFGHTEVARES